MTPDTPLTAQLLSPEERREGPDWAAIERLAATNRPRQADREALNAPAFGEIPGEEWSDREMAEFILRVRLAATPERREDGLSPEELRREIEALPGLTGPINVAGSLPGRIDRAAVLAIVDRLRPLAGSQQQGPVDVERLARAVHIVEQGTFKTQRCYHDATTGEPVDCKWTAELLAAEYDRLAGAATEPADGLRLDAE